MPENNSIKFSVAITTYNHANYLAKNLESIFQQQHDYSFEIVISDDCSTDGTQDVINSYHKKYPNIIRPFFQTKNIGVSRNSMHILRSCRGEYIATLDGDDYWTDPLKIKKQISFLDANPSYVLSCHRFRKLDSVTNNITDDTNDNLFNGNTDGFDFGTEMYFEHWLTQTLTVVFRNSALQNTPVLDTYRYCWDTEIFWTLLTKGRGYIHNFFGGIYLIHPNGVWSGDNEIRQNSMMYLITEELLQKDITNPWLKKIHEIYRYKLQNAEIKIANTKFLELSKIRDKNFSIICNDEWGGEVYKAMNLQELSPFIGMNIYNVDFIELASNLKYYLSKPLQFIDVSRSKHIRDFWHTNGRAYPIAWLDEKVELHFTAYSTTQGALLKWKERIKRINWNNLFLKIDVSREKENVNDIISFNKINFPYVNKVCFVNAIFKKNIDDAIKDDIVFMDYWNPEIEIFFPLSHLSFNVIRWLNGESGKYTTEKPFSNDLFAADQEKKYHYLLRFDHHYFIQFDKNSINLLDSYFPDTVTVNFDHDNEVALINYDKSGLDHFRLSVREELPDTRDQLDLFVDLKNKNDRHVFILAKGNKHHTLTVHLVPSDKIVDHDGTHLTVPGLEQEIPEEFEWMHFDLSIAQAQEMDHLFERIKSFCFYINPENDARGTLQIAAVFIGSVEKFEEIITRHNRRAHTSLREHCF